MTPKSCDQVMEGLPLLKKFHKYWKIGFFHPGEVVWNHARLPTMLNVVPSHYSLRISFLYFHFYVEIRHESFPFSSQEFLSF